MPGPALTADAQRQLLRVLTNRSLTVTADAAKARQAIAALSRCKQMFMEWKAAETQVRRHGGSNFVRTGMSKENQSGLQRIARLSRKLRRALIETAAGHVYLRLSWRGDPVSWRDDVNGVSWRAFLEDLTELERLASAELETRSRKPFGSPGLAMPRSIADIVARTLQRSGYSVSTTGNGCFARVMNIMLEEVGEQSVQNAQRIARDTAKRMRSSPPQ